MFDFLSERNNEVSLLVDIGNGSITASLVLFLDNKKPKFLYTTKSSFVVLEKPNAAELVDSMNRILDETLNTLVKDGFGNKYWSNKSKMVSRALVCFSSPWFIPKIKHIQIQRDSAFVITNDFLEDILSKEEKVFREELKKDFEVIEKSIVNIKINGYVLDKTIGKRARNFDAFLSMSVVSGSFIRKIRSIISKHTHISENNITSHTFPLVSFSVARDVFSNNPDFVLMDVTGEVTDLTLVQNDTIVGTSTFPSGRNYIIRQISKQFNTSYELSESTLRLYIAKKLDEDSIEKIEKILIEIEKEWAIYFENALLELSPHMLLPSKFYITSETDVSDVYKDFMTLSKTDATATIRKNLQITHIDQNTLAGLFENDSTTQVNEFIAILAIFYNKVRNKAE